jgi:hypothetical protein
MKMIVRLLLHCCLNGPVGVNKVTNFPTGENGSICQLIGFKISNSSWKRLAAEFANAIIKIKDFEEVIVKCQQFSQFKNIWPLYPEIKK